MPTSELIARVLIPAILILAVIGVPLAMWWEKHRPTVPAHVAEMRAWRRLSTQEQAAVDAEAITIRVCIDQTNKEAAARAEEAVRLAVERAARTNALFRP
jgi:hypothetical protein